MNQPFISIVTINLNNAAGLKKTLHSILSQDWKDKELIVIDGGSNDESVSIIEEYALHIKYWISEKDKGIYNAQNKGLRHCIGKYVNFMNSGDTYFNEFSLSNLANAATRGFDIVYGNVYFIAPGVKEWIKEYPSKPDLKFWRYDTPAHNASLIKTTKLLRSGGYDEKLLICSDWKFFVQAKLIHNMRFKHVNQTVSVFYLNGISAEEKNQALISKERELVWNEIYKKPGIMKTLWKSISIKLMAMMRLNTNTLSKK